MCTIMLAEEERRLNEANKRSNRELMDRLKLILTIVGLMLVMLVVGIIIGATLWA